MCSCGDAKQHRIPHDQLLHTPKKIKDRDIGIKRSPWLQGWHSYQGPHLFRPVPSGLINVKILQELAYWPYWEFAVAWWRHPMGTFSALLTICAGNSPVTVEFPHKGQWRGALMFSFICTWINSWVNNPEAGDFETPSCPLWRHSNGAGPMHQPGTGQPYVPLAYHALFKPAQ